MIYEQIFLLILLLFLPRAAEAYLDPGSGSYFLQILAAFGLSILFFTRRWWGMLLGKLKSRENQNNDTKKKDDDQSI